MSYLGCSARLYIQSFVGGIMSYLGCSARLYTQSFVGGIMSNNNIYLWYVTYLITTSTAS
jgi:hypothetical protein